MLNGELRGDVPAHRLADETKLAQLERLEQLQVMEHEVVDLGDRGILGRRSEARMIRNHDAELSGPRRREIEARDRAGAVQVHERRPAAGLENYRVDAIDLQLAA